MHQHTPLPTHPYLLHTYTPHHLHTYTPHLPHSTSRTRFLHPLTHLHSSPHTLPSIHPHTSPILYLYSFFHTPHTPYPIPLSLHHSSHSPLTHPPLLSAFLDVYSRLLLPSIIFTCSRFPKYCYL